MRRQRQPGDVRPLQQRGHRLRRAARIASALRPRRRGGRVGSRMRPRTLLHRSIPRIRTARSSTSPHQTCRACSPSATSSRRPLQPSGAVEGWRDNPVDDQNTVYGLTVSQGDGDDIFVSERERGLVRQLQIVAAPGGRLTYRPVRTFLFDTTFDSATRAARPTTGRRAARPPWKNRNPKASCSIARTRRSTSHSRQSVSTSCR